MYSEQLALLLFIAASQMAGPGVGVQPTAQTPRSGAERAALPLPAGPLASRVGKPRNQIKREREAMLLAEFR